MALSPDQLERQSRHILLKEIGGVGVQRLRAGSVSIVGAGGLGGPCALYLAAAGVGRIELVDADAVDLSNLQRQVQFGAGDVGAGKARCLAARLREIDPDIQVAARPARFAEGDALSGQVLVDASDNFETRYRLNRLAHATGKRLVSGAAIGWAAQVAVFGSGVSADEPCYRCFVPEAPPRAATCEEAGVVGAVTGIAGVRMALEVFKLLSGAGEPLRSQLWRFDGLTGQERTVVLRPDPACPVCGD